MRRILLLLLTLATTSALPVGEHQRKSVLSAIRRKLSSVSAEQLVPEPDFIPGTTEEAWGAHHSATPVAATVPPEPEVIRSTTPMVSPEPVAKEFVASASPSPEPAATNPAASPEPNLVATEPSSPYVPYNPTVTRRYQGSFSLAHTDKRSYRYVELDNGMKVLLGSDPSATMAAASVDVSTGSYSDPIEYPGLAHFCEHMLFLSNAKFPEEDEYETFLASAGGGSNAFTDKTHTNFFFEVSTGYLEPALERLAAFFIAPTFATGASSDQVDRERNAVDSENSKNLQDDEWRTDQLLHSLSSNLSKHHSFSTGNKETLTGGEQLREALTAWYKSHYSSHIMSLALTGNQSLDDLESWALTYFGPLERRPGVIAGRASSWELAVPSEQLPRLVRYEPLGPDSLELVWFLPGELKSTRSHPLNALSSLFSKETEGSLTLALADQGWIEELWAGADEEEEDETVFSISVTLTPSGVEHVQEVIATVFAAVEKAKDTATDPQWWEQDVRAQELAFMYAKPPDVSQEMVELSGLLKQDYEPLELPRAAYVAREQDADELVRLLGLMSLERVTILYGTAKHDEDEDDDGTAAWEVEKWYGTKYQSRLFTEEERARYAAPSAVLVAKLTKPGVNPYYPSEEGLKMITVAEQAPPEASPEPLPGTMQPGGPTPFYATAGPLTVPVLLASDARSRTWHALDVSFGMPMAYFGLKLYLPHAAHSGLGRVATSVLVGMANEQMRALKQQLLDAGVQMDLSPTSSGLELTLAGFSERLPQVMLATLDQLSNLTACPDHFAVAKESTRDEQEAWATANPSRTAATLTSSLMSFLAVELPPENEALLDKLTLEGLFGNRTHLNMLSEVSPVLEPDYKLIEGKDALTQDEEETPPDFTAPLTDIDDIGKLLTDIDDIGFVAAEPAKEWQEARGGPVAFRKKRGDSAKKGALEFSALLNPEPAAPKDDGEEAEQSAELSASEGENEKLVGVKAFDFLAVGNVEASVASGLHADLNERLFGEVTELGAVGTDPSTTDLAGGSASSMLVQAPLGQARVLLPSGSRLAYAIEHPSPDQTQSAVELTIQLGRRDKLGIQQDAAALILGKFLPGKFFADLRTQQQLGYVVQSALGTHFGIRELVFLVQGTAQPPGNVSKSILTFVDSMPELVKQLNADDFSSYVDSTKASLLQSPISIEDEGKGLGVTLFSKISENCTSSFDYNAKLAAAMDTVTLADVLAFAEAIVEPQGQYSRLLVQVYGRKQQPLPETSVFPPDYVQLNREAHYQEATYLGCEGPTFPAPGATAVQAPEDPEGGFLGCVDGCPDGWEPPKTAPAEPGAPGAAAEPGPGAPATAPALEEAAKPQEALELPRKVEGTDSATAPASEAPAPEQLLPAIIDAIDANAADPAVPDTAEPGVAAEQLSKQKTNVQWWCPWCSNTTTAAAA